MILAWSSIFYCHGRSRRERNEGKTESRISKCHIVCPRSPDVALIYGRGEANWYKVSFKLYRLTRKINYYQYSQDSLMMNILTCLPARVFARRKYWNNINWSNEANSNVLRQSSDIIFYAFPRIAIHFCRFRHFSSLYHARTCDSF